MKGAVFLALAYLRHTRLRSAVLILALALIVFVPLATRQVLSVAQTQLTARAAETPLMIGARGSALDLIMNGLYFSADRPEPVTMGAAGPQPRPIGGGRAGRPRGRAVGPWPGRCAGHRP